jgi:hypothetical protein
LEVRRSEYYQALRALDGPEGWNRWIEFFLAALAEQSRENTAKARGILALRGRLVEQVSDLTRSKHTTVLLDHVFRKPIFEPNSLLGDRALASKPAVMILLGKMREAGILRVLRPARGRRPQILALAELVNLCEGRKVL